MKPQKAVIQETRRIAVGTAILCAAMLLVFLVIGKMTGLVALGALIGYALAVGNFFVMVMDVQRLTEGIDPSAENAVKTAKAKMRLSYNRRMLAMVVLDVEDMAELILLQTVIQTPMNNRLFYGVELLVEDI